MDIKAIYESMEYGPAPEQASYAFEWIHRHQGTFNLFIDGKWPDPHSGTYFESINPSNKSVLGKIAVADNHDVDKAVFAARKALDNWAGMSGSKRGTYLYALARQIQKHARLFAVLESLDNGKPIRETRDIDIPLVIRHFYHHAGWAALRDTTLEDYKEIGVVGQIIPWNFPLLMLAWKIAPAIAMGNTVVLKPAEDTSLTALLFAEICNHINLPDGVVNIITGAGETGAALVAHPGVNKVAFTGSTDVGKHIQKATAGSGKKLSLELGGKSPYIVFEDADIDSAVEGLVDAIWFNQGQVCCAGSRLLVQESIADRFYSKLRLRMSKLRVGDALDKGIDMGAIVSEKQHQRIHELVEQGVSEGNSLWKAPVSCPTDGFFMPPMLFSGVAPSSNIAQEEIFGPVLVGMTFRSPKEAIALANNTKYGLAATIWTENINLALDLAPKVKAGTIWINTTNAFDAAAGFGGYRESGYGREGGIEGLYEYVKLRKSIDSSQSLSLDNQNYAELKDVLDRTPKLYIGGLQKRPDGGYSLPAQRMDGKVIGEVPRGNRKDVRDAVEAAHKASAWAQKTGHERAQVLYFIAENLQARADEFAHRIRCHTPISAEEARRQVHLAIERIFYYAAWADKYDGNVHNTVKKHVTLAMPESIGVVGIICPETPGFIGFISLVIPAIAMGNSVVILPSMQEVLTITEFYQVLETSDLPGGVVNIITGNISEVAPTLAAHDNVDGLWYFGDADNRTEMEKLAAENMKRLWVNYDEGPSWLDDRSGQGPYFLRKASQIKNIWIPYGV